MKVVKLKDLISDLATGRYDGIAENFSNLKPGVYLIAPGFSFYTNEVTTQEFKKPGVLIVEDESGKAHAITGGTFAATNTKNYKSDGKFIALDKLVAGGLLSVSAGEVNFNPSKLKTFFVEYDNSKDGYGLIINQEAGTATLARSYSGVCKTTGYTCPIGNLDSAESLALFLTTIGDKVDLSNESFVSGYMKELAEREQLDDETLAEISYKAFSANPDYYIQNEIVFPANLITYLAGLVNTQIFEEQLFAPTFLTGGLVQYAKKLPVFQNVLDSTTNMGWEFKIPTIVGEMINDNQAEQNECIAALEKRYSKNVSFDGRIGAIFPQLAIALQAEAIRSDSSFDLIKGTVSDSILSKGSERFLALVQYAKQVTLSGFQARPSNAVETYELFADLDLSKVVDDKSKQKGLTPESKVFSGAVKPLTELLLRATLLSSELKVLISQDVKYPLAEVAGELDSALDEFYSLYQSKGLAPKETVSRLDSSIEKVYELYEKMGYTSECPTFDESRKLANKIIAYQETKIPNRVLKSDVDFTTYLEQLEVDLLAISTYLKVTPLAKVLETDIGSPYLPEETYLTNEQKLQLIQLYDMQKLVDLDILKKSDAVDKVVRSLPLAITYILKGYSSGAQTFINNAYKVLESILALKRYEGSALSLAIVKHFVPKNVTGELTAFDKEAIALYTQLRVASGFAAERGYEPIEVKSNSLGLNIKDTNNYYFLKEDELVKILGLEMFERMRQQASNFTKYNVDVLGFTAEGDNFKEQFELPDNPTREPATNLELFNKAREEFLDINDINADFDTEEALDKIILTILAGGNLPLIGLAAHGTTLALIPNATVAYSHGGVEVRHLANHKPSKSRPVFVEKEVDVNFGYSKLQPLAQMVLKDTGERTSDLTKVGIIASAGVVLHSVKNNPLRKELPIGNEVSNIAAFLAGDNFHIDRMILSERAYKEFLTTQRKELNFKL